MCLWRAKLEKENSEVALGLRTLTSHDFSKQVLKSLVDHLEPCAVIIPFPESLTDILNMKVLRVRGDYTKILTFIKLYAFLNQNRLPKLETEKGKIICVTPDLCIEALKAIAKPLVSMTSNLEERSRKLIEVFKKLELDGKDAVLGKTEREKVSVELGKSEKTIRSYLSEWEAAGYCSSDEKKPKTFTLLYDIEDIEKKTSGISAKLESANLLMEKMSKEAREWFDSLLEIGSLRVGDNIFQHYAMPLPIQKLPISNHELSNSKPSLEESTLENRQNTKLAISKQDFKFTIQEALEKARERFRSGVEHDKQDFDDFFMSLGLSAVETSDIFQHLNDRGELSWRNTEDKTLWSWRK